MVTPPYINLSSLHDQSDTLDDVLLVAEM